MHDKTGTSGSVRAARDAGSSTAIRDSREPLLRTKLFIPPLRRKRVTRPDLIDCINKSAEQALVLICAPAGFGKTTLLAEWAAQAAVPVAWLSLDSEDNDPSRFLRYVVAALNTALAGNGISIGAASGAMLKSIQPLPVQAALVALINELVDLTEPLALVLDDYQFITDPGVHEGLAFLLEHLPAHTHLLIASRVDPDIPLHRLRAAQRLREMRTEDLRFSTDEAADFTNTVMGLGLSDEDISTLNARAEGWIVGLQMAALSMQGLGDRSSFIRTFSGSNRFILEYLIEEVLSRQSPKVQAFLLDISILDRLCAALCDAVHSETSGSHQVLEDLERSNLFLTPLDPVGGWYRLHHLFADLLRARLQRSRPERVATLHLRASEWFDEAGLPEEAIQHAFAAQELDRAASLVERYGLDVLSRGEMSSLLKLFDALPVDLMGSRPALAILHAWSLTFSGQLAKVEPALREAEKQIEQSGSEYDVDEILGSVAIIRGLIADFRGDMVSAIELAQSADRLLPGDNLAARSIVPFVLGDGYLATGELHRAEAAFERIKKIGQASGNLWTIAVALHKLALLKKLQGRLRDVWDIYQEAVELAGERGGRRYGTMGATYVGLSDLLRERNELEGARQMVTQAIQNMEHWQSPTDLVNAYVTLARILLSRDEIKGAEDALAKAEAMHRRGNIFPVTSRTLEACQVRLWIAKGDPGMALQWAKGRRLDERSPATDGPIDYLRELEWITMARLLIARNEWGRALSLLASLAESARTAGRNGRLIEILVLTALALNGSGKTAEARDNLEAALELAEPEGYMRVFLDEGRPLHELLGGCARTAGGSRRTYIQRILAGFGTGETGQTQEGTRLTESLIEPLTGREIEVLHLLHGGLSNREIAARLYLSEGTVKTHTHNIYAKLGVQSRARAVARAEELQII
ncbi:MAG: LuxR C-terminal-related transcriptional regulator [Bacteroidota bacterium]